MNKELSAKIHIPGMDKCPSPDILLVMCPPWDAKMPPHGLACLSSYLRQRGFKTLVLDANIWLFNLVKNKKAHLWEYENCKLWDDEELFHNTKKDFEKYIDILVEKILSIDTENIGFNFHISNKLFVIEVAKRIKAKNKNKHIIVGGPSCFIKEDLETIPRVIDFIVTGEGEEKIHNLLKAIKNKKGRIRRIWDSQDRPDLERMPFPTYEEFSLKDYLYQDIPLVTSRGCIGKCAFCFDRRFMGLVRFVPPENIIKEINHHVEKYNIRNFPILDSLVNADARRLEKLCDLIIESNLDICWTASAIPISNLSPRLLAKMKKAGCSELIFGLESGSDRVLRDMGKLFTSREAESVTRSVSGAGIKVVINIIVGFPTESEEDFLLTMDFIRRNRKFINRIGSLNLCHTYSGTPLVDRCEDFGIIPNPRNDEYFPSDKWVTRDGNSHEVRQRRMNRLLSLLADLNLPFDDTNTEYIPIKKDIERHCYAIEGSYMLNLGNLCNNNCLICELLGKKGRKNKNPLEIKRELLSLNRRDEIVVTGGEPLLRKDLDKILNHISAFGFKRTGLKTNGRMFYYSNFADKLSKRFNYFIIPVYGHKAVLHDYITMVPGSFNQTIGGIKNLIKRNREVEAELIITSLNCRHLCDCINLLHNLGVKRIRFLYPLCKKGFEKYMPNVSETIVDYIDDAIALAKTRGMEVITGKAPFNPTKPDDLELAPKGIRKTELGTRGTPMVSIIIPTYNRRDSLKLTLTSLFSQNYPPEKYEIIVVDDGSQDSTGEMIKSLHPPCTLKYIYWPREMPYVFGELRNRAGPARNLGISYARGEILLFVDSDIVADLDFIREHMKHHEKEKDIVVIGYRFWLPESRRRIDEKTITGDFGSIRRLFVLDDLREPSYSLYGDDIDKMPSGWDHFHTNNASVAKRHVVEAGNFDPSFISWSTEDNELGYRLHRMGLRFILNRKSIGYHLYNKPEHINARKNLEMNLYAKNIFYKKYLDREIYDAFKLIFNHRDYNEVKIGNYCNNNCTVCAGLDKKNDRAISLSEIKRDSLAGRRDIVIAGGEAVLNRNFQGILDYLSSRGARYISIKTNGRPFSDLDFARKISKKVRGSYCVYVYGRDAETHDRITRVKGSYKETLVGIKNLLKLGQKISLIIPITSLNYQDLPSIIRYFASLGVHWFTLYYPHQPHDPSLFMMKQCNLRHLKESVPPLGKAIKYVNKALELSRKGLMVKANLYYFEK